jgi:hypothetical protein
MLEMLSNKTKVYYLNPRGASTSGRRVRSSPTISLHVPHPPRVQCVGVGVCCVVFALYWGQGSPYPYEPKNCSPLISTNFMNIVNIG